jgi:hypothetical protein
MGGPSGESHLAAQKRRQERLDALRTRGGIVDLAEWLKALPPTVNCLERLLHESPWLLGVGLAAANDVGFELASRSCGTRRKRACAFRRHVPVRIVVRDLGAEAA